jgi:hypothetical protein
MPKFTYDRYNLAVEAEERMNDLDLELFCFRATERIGGMLPKSMHFRNIVEMIWGSHNQQKHFIWHPWAEWYLENSCKWKYLSVLGCGNSGKTDFFSMWAIVNWLAMPLYTKVMVTSTSLKESRKRIWGAVREYFMAAESLPGKLIDSLGMIRTTGTDEAMSDRCGIELIAGEKKKEKEAVGKLIGIKAKRIILIADEMPELSSALTGAFKSNLALNPESQMIGIGNFASEFDPLGEFARPVVGYEKLKPDDVEWETEDGYCIRADGLKSPNILAGRDDFPFIYKPSDLAEHRRTLGENSLLFWRMCRSFPCPEGAANVIFPEQDLRAGNVYASVIWMAPPIRIAAIDTAFTSGGDRNIAVFGSFGTDTDGNQIISFDEYHNLTEDVEIADKSQNTQIAIKYRDMCQDRKIPPEHAAYDSTAGGGILFGEILATNWSARCYGIQFGGRASEILVSLTDTRKAREAYANRVTEIWYAGQEFCRSGQLRNMPKDMAKELKARRYVTTKTEGTRVKVESKEDMKIRTGFSPDIADAGMMLVMLAKEVLGAKAGDAIIARMDLAQPHDELVEKLQDVEAEADYSEDNWETFVEL